MHRVLALLVGLVVAACGTAPQTPQPTLAPGPSPSLSPLPSQPGSSPVGNGSAAPSTRPSPSAPVLSIRTTLLGLGLPQPLSRAVAFDVDGSILVCGGLLASGATTGTILRLDLAASSSAAIGELADPVHDAAGVAVDGMNVIFGGGRAAPMSTVQRCDGDGSSAVIGSLPSPRADVSAVSITDVQAEVLGGGTTTSLPRAVLETTRGTDLRVSATLIDGVRYAAVAAVGLTILVIGGYRGGHDVAEIQAVDLGTGTARIVGHLPSSLAHASALVIGGTIVVAGGSSNGTPQSTIWCVAPGSWRISRCGTLPRPVSDVAAVMVDGVGYLVGGEDAKGPVTSIVELTGG
jgi:hypothetical protein